MKQALIIVSICVCAFTVNAQSKEDKLKQTIDLYFNSGQENLTKAFHPNAELRFVRDGQFTQLDVATYISRSKPWDKNDGTIKKLLSFDITGNAASAKLSIEGKTFSITDYMNLLYIDDQWKIVGKIFNSVPKPAN